MFRDRQKGQLRCVRSVCRIDCEPQKPQAEEVFCFTDGGNYGVPMFPYA